VVEIIVVLWVSRVGCLDARGESSIVNALFVKWNKYMKYMSGHSSLTLLIRLQDIASTMVQGQHLKMDNSRCDIVGDLLGKDSNRDDDKTER